jgi:hypothetical protein
MLNAARPINWADTLDWTKGITEVDLVSTINDSGSGHVRNFPDLKDETTPTEVRIAMVQLSNGSAYDASALAGTGGVGDTGGGGGTGAGGKQRRSSGEGERRYARRGGAERKRERRRR